MDALLSYGDALIAEGELWKGEQCYAEVLKLAEKEQNTDMQRVCFQKLGDVYLAKKAYTQATALYNTALHLAKEKQPYEVLIHRIKRTEKLLLEEVLKHPVNPELISTPESDAAHKASLISIREKAKEEIVRIDKELNPYGREDYDPHHPKIKQLEIARAKAIRELYQEIAEERKCFIKTLVKECMAVLGEPPCQYAMISLGSFARQEATPYSDLEWAILIEEENETSKAYFRTLTTLLHLKVINLGETILPSLVIESLNPAYPKEPSENWFYDAITPRGFAFDGHMPKACKTPLGKTMASGLKEGQRDREGKQVFELIHTPQKMAEFQKEEWYLEDPLFPQGMLTCSLIDGDKALVENYRTEMIERLQKVSPETSLFVHQTRAMVLLVQDLRNHYLMLEDPDAAGKLYDVKKEIYRLPDRIIEGLAFYYLLNSTSSWERIEELYQRGMMTQEASDHLKVAMNIATELRLRTYLALDKQGETMTGMAALFTESQSSISMNVIQKAFQMPHQEMLFRFYYTALPLQALLIEALRKAPAQEGQLRNLFSKEQHLLDTSDGRKGAIYHRLLHYLLAKQYFEKALVQDPKDFDSLVFLGHTSFSLGDYKTAIASFKQAFSYLEGNDLPNLAVIYTNLGSAYEKFGDSQKAIAYLQQALVMNEKLFGRHHPSVALTLANLGTIYGALGEPQKKVEFLQKALEIKEKHFGRYHPYIANILNNLGTTYGALGKHHKAIELLKEALEIREKIFSKDHPYVAETLNNLGLTYMTLGEFQKAIDFLQKALGITEKIYGRQHPSVAAMLDNLGVAYGELGELQKKINALQEALGIAQKFFGRQHLSVAKTLNNLGTTCMALGEHQKAVAFLEEALEVTEKLFGRQHPSRIEILNNLGISYRELGEYTKAIAHLQEVLGLTKKLFGPHHPSIIAILNNLGNAYLKLANGQKNIFKEVLGITNGKDSFKEALEVTEKIYGRQHPSSAAILTNLGNIYKALGESKKAIDCLKEALGIEEGLYGQQRPSLALILFNLGLTYEACKNSTDAFDCIAKAYDIYAKNVGKQHVTTVYIREHLYRLGMTLGNRCFLQQESEAAKTFYQKLGLNITDPQVHVRLAADAYRQNNLTQVIEHFQILTLLTPYDARNWHNLGCSYHLDARNALAKKDKQKYQQQLQKAENCFLKSLAQKADSGTHLEYANFLLINHKKGAKDHLLTAIALKEEGRILEYGKMEKLTLSQELQQEIEANGAIRSKVSLFAYYHLLTQHQKLGLNQIELEKYLGGFRGEVAMQDTSFSYSVLGYCYRALKKYPEAAQSFSEALKRAPDSPLCKKNDNEMSRLGRERSSNCMII